MKFILKIVLLVIILAFLVLWCVLSVKGISFGEFFKGLSASAEPVVATACTAFKICSGGGVDV